ncbi:hypothetical protein J7L05_00795, partial [bacterium]|nr:hypothetical protein [bacterium]
LKKPIISQTVGATLRGCPVFMPIFRVGTETYPLHSALFQQPLPACIFVLILSLSQMNGLENAQAGSPHHNIYQFGYML